MSLAPAQLLPVWQSTGGNGSGGYVLDLPKTGTLPHSDRWGFVDRYAYSPGGVAARFDSGTYSLQHFLEFNETFRDATIGVDFFLYDPSLPAASSGGFDNPYVTASLFDDGRKEDDYWWDTLSLSGYQASGQSRSARSLITNGYWYSDTFGFAPDGAGYDLTYSVQRLGQTAPVATLSMTSSAPLGNSALGVQIYYSEFYGGGSAPWPPTGIGRFDNFTFETVESVPEPGLPGLIAIGLCVLAMQGRSFLRHGRAGRGSRPSRALAQVPRRRINARPSATKTSAQNRAMRGSPTGSGYHASHSTIATPYSSTPPGSPWT